MLLICLSLFASSGLCPAYERSIPAFPFSHPPLLLAHCIRNPPHALPAFSFSSASHTFTHCYLRCGNLITSTFRCCKYPLYMFASDTSIRKSIFFPTTRVVSAADATASRGSFLSWRLYYTHTKLCGMAGHRCIDSLGVITRVCTYLYVRNALIQPAPEHPCAPPHPYRTFK